MLDSGYKQCIEDIAKIDAIPTDIREKFLPRDLHELSLTLKTEYEKAKGHERHAFLRENCDVVSNIAKKVPAIEIITVEEPTIVPKNPIHKQCVENMKLIDGLPADIRKVLPRGPYSFSLTVLNDYNETELSKKTEFLKKNCDKVSITIQILKFKNQKH